MATGPMLSACIAVPQEISSRATKPAGMPASTIAFASLRTSSAIDVAAPGVLTAGLCPDAGQPIGLLAKGRCRVLPAPDDGQAVGAGSQQRVGDVEGPEALVLQGLGLVDGRDQGAPVGHDTPDG